MNKPNCYKCKFREGISGDCHSRCAHPNALMSMAKSLMYGHTSPVTGDPHGVNNGWFFWPINFDPIWLVSCDLYEEMDICVCGHSADYHDGDGIGECYYNEHCSGATGCLCPQFKQKKEKEK